MNKTKLYVVVRQDLPPGAQLAQAVHATAQFAQEHPHCFTTWQADGKNVVVLGVESEQELHVTAMTALDYGVEHSVFREPDYKDEMTAAVFAPVAEHLLSSLPLAGKKRKPKVELIKNSSAA